MKKITLKITSLLLIGVMLLSSSGIEILAEELPEIIPEENYEPEIPSEEISLPEDTSLDVEDENMPTEDDFQDDSVPEEFFENEDLEENTPEYEYVEENNDDIEMTEDVEASSDELIYGDFDYYIERDYSDNVEYAVIKKYWGSSPEIVIPDFIDEYPVKKLGNGSFLDRFISKIYIPDSVTSIGQNAFKNCQYMYEINFPQNLTSIGESAFENCISLNSVSLPNNKTRIDSYAFRGCSSLTTVTLPYYATMGSSVFSDCINLEKVKISEACDYTHSDVYYDYISSSDFKNCPKLTEIEIPNGTGRIEQSAFRDSVALQSILLPETLSEIKEFAFKDCSSLTEIEIPDNCSVYEGAFENCTSLKKVVLGNNVSLYDNPFAGCSSLETVILGENVSFSKDDFLNAYIKDSTEQYMYLLQDGYAYICEYLGNETSVEIPNTIDGYPVKELSSALFQDNTLLSSVIISEGIKVIGANTFSGCTNLTNISIPASITSICDYAFCDCTSLETVNLPSTLTHLGMGVFINCKALKRLEPKFSALTLNDMSSLFSGCENLEYVDLSSASFATNVQATSMFYNCKKIKFQNIKWPQNKENIASSRAISIFEKCESIDEVDLSEFPFTKNTFLDDSFYECTGLKKISFANCKMENVDMCMAFTNCKSLHTIDFSGCDIKGLLFPNGVTWGCTSLKTIDFTNSSFEDFSMYDAFANTPVSTVIFKDSTFIKGDINNAFYECSIVNLSIENSSFIDTNCWIMFYFNEKLTNLTIKDSVFFHSNMYSAFAVCSSLENVYFENVTFDMGYSGFIATFFENCYSLKNVRFNNVYFKECSGTSSFFEDTAITNLSFNHVTFEKCNLSVFLCGCDKIKSFDFNDTQFIQVHAMSNFFSSCSNLKYVDFSEASIVDSQGIVNLFSGCSSLESVNFGSSSFANIPNMDAWFTACENLKEVNFEDASFENIASMTNFFANCPNLSKVDTSNATFINIGNLSGMFSGCSKLENITLNIDNEETESTNLTQMFSGCSSLKTCDLSDVYASNIEYDSIFEGCNLEKVYLPRTEKDIPECLFNCQNEEATQINTIIYYGSSTDLEELGLTNAEYLSEYSIVDFDNKDISTISGKKIICMGNSENNFYQVELGGLTNSKLIGAGKYYPQEECTVSIELCSDETFLGWYNEKGKRVSKEQSYSFKVTKNTSLTAKVKNYKYFNVEPISDQTYTGSAIKPEVEVYSNGTLLHPNVDYKISYVNNKKAASSTAKKAPAVKITGKGKYKGTQSVKFNILPKDIASEDVISDELFVNYNAKIQKKVPTLKFNSKKLKNKADYTVEYEDSSVDAYKEIGTYVITLKGKGNFSGEKQVLMHITNDKLLSKMSFTKVKPQTYTGYEITPQITIKDGKTTLLEGTHYTLEYVDNTRMGTASIIITAVEGSGYAGKVIKTFDIGGINISKAKITNLPKSVTFAEEYIVFKGDEAPSLMVKIDGMQYKLTEGIDYITTYSDNYNAGKAKITFKGINKYIGSISKTFKINKFSFSDYKLDTNILNKVCSASEDDEAGNSLEGDFYFKKKDIKEKISVQISSKVLYTSGIYLKLIVKKGEKELTEGKHYSTSCEITGNGEFTIKIKGIEKNNYTGTLSIKNEKIKKRINLDDAFVSFPRITQSKFIELFLNTKKNELKKKKTIKSNLQDIAIINLNEELKTEFNDSCTFSFDENSDFSDFYSSTIKETHYVNVVMEIAQDTSYFSHGQKKVILEIIPDNSLKSDESNVPQIYTFTNDEGRGDSTLIILPDENKTSILIDAGGKTTHLAKKLKKTSCYKTKTKTITIDYLILTHSHSDHINGLASLEKYADSKGIAIVIKNMYYNVTYCETADNAEENKENGEEATEKIIPNTFIKDFKENHKKIKVGNFTYIQTYTKDGDAAFINCDIEDYKLQIVPALKKYVIDDYHYEYKEDDGSTVNYFTKNESKFAPGPATLKNDSCSTVILTDTKAKNKIIFAGDYYCQVFNDIMNNEKYISIKNAFTSRPEGYTVYYKVSHHGRRGKETFKTDSPYLEYEKAFISELKPDYLIGTSWKASDSTAGTIYQKRYKKMIDSIGNNYSPQFYSSFDALFPKHSSKTEKK